MSRGSNHRLLLSLAGAALTVCATTVSRARADPPLAPTNAVDVTLPEPSSPRRIFAIEWNPVALVIDRLSANLEIVPLDHHALVLSPFYFDSRTSSFERSSGDLVLSQRFAGVGVEVGYRYYEDQGGPRGFFAGGSFLSTDVQATAPNGTQTSFMNYGVAIDVGYQALVADDWVLSLGAGAQLAFPSQQVPQQQAPAAYYANRGLRPRILVALGYAF